MGIYAPLTAIMAFTSFTEVPQRFKGKFPLESPEGLLQSTVPSLGDSLFTVLEDAWPAGV